MITASGFHCNRFMIITVLLFSAKVLFGSAVYDYPDTASPGEMMEVIVLSEKQLYDYYAELKNSAGRSIKIFRGFSIQDAGFKISDDAFGGVNCIIIPLAFDFRLEPGDYAVTLTGMAGESHEEYTFELELAEREFRTIKIALNSELTQLRTRVTDRRTEETRNLIRLLAEFNTAGVFKKGSVEIPLKDSYYIETSLFGDRRQFLYTCGENASSYHFGIDYAAETGTPVYSCAEGRIVFSGNRIITGNSVIIEHLPGLYSIYYHLDELYAEKGKTVEKGALIGTVGSTGLSTGPHLHWELRNQSVPVDPAFMLGRSVIDKKRIISIIKDNF